MIQTSQVVDVCEILELIDQEAHALRTMMHNRIGNASFQYIMDGIDRVRYHMSMAKQHSKATFTPRLPNYMVGRGHDIID